MIEENDMKAIVLIGDPDSYTDGTVDVDADTFDEACEKLIGKEVEIDTCDDNGIPIKVKGVVSEVLDVNYYWE